MSGLEIAGVVLAVLPIAIAAIEKYRERQPLSAFRHKDPFVLRLLQALNTQKYLLKSDIQLTLHGAGVDYNRFSDQVNPVVFKDSAVADAVNDYLGNDAEVYYDAVERCYMILADVVGRIEGLVPVPSDLTNLVLMYPQSGGRYQLPKKLRFPVKLHDLQRQIDELDHATATLRRVSDSMIRVREQVTLRSSSAQATAFISALNKVRNHAKQLYLAISAAYSSHCHSQHDARLFLSSRSHLLDNPKGIKEKRTLTFTVLFSPAIAISGPTPSYRTDIEVAEMVDSGSGAVSAKKKVVIRPPTQPTTPDPPCTEIYDLCQSIQRARDGGSTLDLFLSEGKYLAHRYMARSPSGDSIHGLASLDGFITLEELLKDKSHTEWLRGPKMVLSSIVASSTIQLVSTPWLRLPLTSRSVRFSRIEVQKALLNPKAIPEPFVEEYFTTTSSRNPIRRPRSVQEYMLELGILLLEIDRWRAIDDYQAECLISGQPVLSNRHEIARNWAEATELDRLQFHQSAIERCIDCTFATSGSTRDWEDGVLRKSIVDLVIRPLQENCPVVLL